MTPARERKAKERAARKKEGLVRIEAWVPADHADNIRRAVAAMVYAAPMPSVHIWEWSEGPIDTRSKT